jgi:serine phosphatase RsbU (regulator of sigma subunit)
LATELRARGMPLGLMPGMSYEERETTLLSGDSILFYSDGLVEAHNPHFEMFGTPRLRSLLTEHPADAQNLTAILLEELKLFTGEGWEQEDDITLLALRNFASQACG